MHNQEVLTRACLASLRPTTVPFELCVVDNGSTDGSAQVAGDMLGEVDERGVQRAGQGRDHLAGGFLAAALDLGQILGRDPGPGRRLGQRFLLFLAQDPEPPAEHFPPEGLLGLALPESRFPLGFTPQRIHVRVLGHTSA